MISREPDLMIAQGSTPTVRLRLPFNLAGTETIYVTISQEGQNVIEYMTANGTSTSITSTQRVQFSQHDAKECFFEMTQAETLSLQEGDFNIQCRVKASAGADTFLPWHGWVVRADKEGTI